MGDDDYAFQERVAEGDLTDAGQLKADAATMRAEADHDFTEADTLQGMGVPDRGEFLRVEGTFLEGTAVDFDHRAAQLEHSASLDHAEKDLLVERDRAGVDEAAAAAHAAGAQIVLDFADLSEADRTRWTAEAGAAAGEATALHQRKEDLGGQGAAKGQEASKEHDAAHAGLDGRHWTGEGRPPGASAKTE